MTVAALPLISVPVAVLLPAAVPVLVATALALLLAPPLPLLLALPDSVLVAPPSSGTTVCVPLPSVHGYWPGGIVSADASSAACDNRVFSKISQLGRWAEAGMELVMEMGRSKIV